MMILSSSAVLHLLDWNLYFPQEWNLKERMLKAPKKYIVPSIVFLPVGLLFCFYELPVLYYSLNCSMIEEWKHGECSGKYMKDSHFDVLLHLKIMKSKKMQIICSGDNQGRRIIVSIIMEMRRGYLYPVWPSQWFVRFLKVSMGWPCNQLLESRAFGDVPDHPYECVHSGRTTPSCGCWYTQSRWGLSARQTPAMEWEMNPHKYAFKKPAFLISGTLAPSKRMSRVPFKWYHGSDSNNPTASW